jgi:hypothetical protein
VALVGYALILIAVTRAEKMDLLIAGELPKSGGQMGNRIKATYANAQYTQRN